MTHDLDLTGSIPDISALIGLGVANQPAKKWPAFDGTYLDRTQFVTASNAGYCRRKNYFDNHSVAVDPLRWGYFERGHNMERWVVEQILLSRHADFTFLNMGDDQVSYYNGFQSGTPDVLAFNEEMECFVGDFKSIDPRTNYKYLPKIPHFVQVQVNIDLVRSCTDYNVVGGFLHYLDASDYQKDRQFTFPPDEDLMREKRLQAREVMTAKGAGDLPPEGMWTSDGCKYCDHHDACGEYLEQKTETDNLMEEAERALENVFRRS